MKNIIELIYSLFLGLALATTSSFAISTFYQAPEFPEYPSFGYSEPPSEEETKVQDQFDKKQREYEDKSTIYEKNYSRILLGVSVVMFIIGLALSRLSKVKDILSDGVMFGAVFIAVVSLIKNTFPFYFFEQPDRAVTLAASLWILIMVLIITHLKFGLLNNKPKKTTKK